MKCAICVPHGGWRRGASRRIALWSLIASMLASAQGGCSEPRCDCPNASSSVDRSVDSGVAADASARTAFDSSAVDATSLSWGADPSCAAYGQPESVSKLSGPWLDEISGLAASARHPGVLWAHNDSGDGAWLYAIGPKGKAVVRLAVPVPVRDWEDIALAPCAPGGDVQTQACLFVADTGDNGRKQDKGHIVRVPEPATLTTDEGGLVIKTSATRFTFRWPDGPRDVEALVMTPNLRAVLLTKTKPAQLWRVDLQAFDPQAQLLGELTPGDHRPTGADLSPDGAQLLVRTYAHAVVFEVGALLDGPAEKAASSLPTLQPTSVPVGKDAQGEAIAWDRLSGYWHVSEGSGAKIWRVNCAP